VLVTGGAGFIGQRTALALSERGHDVRVLDRLAPPVHPAREWPAGFRARFECLDGDVESPADWSRALAGVNAVIHLAAYQDYLPDFSTFVRVNAAGTALLYELIVSQRLAIEKVVVASSQAVYGEGAYACAAHGRQHPDARPLDQLERADWEIRCPACAQSMTSLATDEAVVKPQNAYGISKLSQESLAISLGRRYQIPTTALRYSITQGAGQSFHNAYSGICRIFSTRVLQRKPLPIYEDGEQRRDYVYVGDVVQANLLALDEPRSDYQAFNVGGAQTLTVGEYAQLVMETAGVTLPLERSGRFRVGDTRHVVSDSSKLRALGWRPSTPVRAVVAEYLAWLQGEAVPERVTEAASLRMDAVGAVGIAR
jgi:dTDP-L-rhamnose 4-epimerase